MRFDEENGIPQPGHVRAARALLAWSQQDLASAAGVSISTISEFESGHRTPYPNNAQAIRGALEGAGIRFLPTGAAIGCSVPSTEVSGVDPETGLTPAEKEISDHLI